MGKTAAFILMLLVAVPGIVYANDPGSSGAGFLGIAPDAATAARGGAGTVPPGGAATLYWNPAGLARQDACELLFTHTPWLNDLTYNHLAYVHGESVIGGRVGGSITLLDYGSINITRINGQAPLTNLGTTDANDMALTLGYGREYGNLDIGIAVKYIQQDIASVKATGLAFDAGIVMRETGVRGLTLGAVLRNMGNGLKFDRDDADMPLQLRLGGAYQLDRVPLVLLADCIIPNDDRVFLNLGTEWRLADMLALRLGYLGDNDAGSGLTAGFGVNLDNQFLVDYAYVPYGDLDDAHHLTMRYRFGQSQPVAPSTVTVPAAPAPRAVPAPPASAGEPEFIPPMPASRYQRIPVTVHRSGGESEYIGDLK